MNETNISDDIEGSDKDTMNVKQPTFVPYNNVRICETRSTSNSTTVFPPLGLFLTNEPGIHGTNQNFRFLYSDERDSRHR